MHDEPKVGHPRTWLPLESSTFILRRGPSAAHPLPREVHAHATQRIRLATDCGLVPVEMHEQRRYWLGTDSTTRRYLTLAEEVVATDEWLQLGFVRVDPTWFRPDPDLVYRIEHTSVLSGCDFVVTDSQEPDWSRSPTA